MKRTFADPRRLRRQAISEAREGEGAIRTWWKERGGTDETRTFRQLPPAIVILELYRDRAEQLVRLEEAETKGELRGPRGRERVGLLKLRRLFSDRPTVEQSLLARLEHGAPGEFYDEDPTFDRWAQMVKRRQIPDAWWGPLGKDPAKLAVLKAKLAKRRHVSSLVKEKK